MEDTKQNRFYYICTFCMEEAKITGLGYRGQVNLSVNAYQADGIIYLNHLCLTCNAKETLIIRREDAILPQDKEAFEKLCNRKFDYQRISKS